MSPRTTPAWAVGRLRRRCSCRGFGPWRVLGRPQPVGQQKQHARCNVLARESWWHRQGPAQFGATELHYSLIKFGKYPGVLVTYQMTPAGVTEYGAQAYLESSASAVITTVISRDAATSEADLRQIVDTIRFT